jgi:cell division protein FtsI (penicillin-binding protein 3)
MISMRIDRSRVVLRNRRIAFVGGVFTVLYLVMALKAFYLQVVADDMLSKRASLEYQKSVKCQGRRGSIYDDKYREMVLSTNVVSVGIHPKWFEDKQKATDIIATKLGMDKNFILRKMKSDQSFTWLNRITPPVQAAALEEESMKGLEFIPAYCRIYPNKVLAAQVLGFSGTDDNGLEGLEFYYDKYLKGDEREWTIMKDALGRIFDSNETCEPGHNGKNLVLTIDNTIQYVAENALKTAVEQENAKSGIAIVMEPATGAIKALANYPTFNPNSYELYPKETWRNRAIADAFEPGSTMKIFVVSAALESGKCTPETMIFCENGRYQLGRNTIHDTHSYGSLTVHDVVKFSSNIGAAKIAAILGPEILYDALKKFGFGEITGIDCPAESSGQLRDYHAWRTIDNATIAFGQGVTVTPIQLVTAVSAIANNGILMKPHLVQAITDSNGQIIKTFSPQEVRRVISPETAQVMKEIMKSVTEQGGTGTWAVPKGYTVCGKTGTAQKLNAEGNYHNCNYNGVFVGFSPEQSPELTVLVVIDSPKKHHYGGVVAAPAFKDIICQAFNYLNVPPEIDPEGLKLASTKK